MLVAAERRAGRGRTLIGTPDGIWLPPERPTGKGAVSRWGRKVADAIGEAISAQDMDTLEDTRKKVEEAGWLNKQIPNIIASQEPARDFAELNAAARAEGSRPGRDDHHIIEQGPQNGDLPREIIDAEWNLVRIPRYAHWKVNARYQVPQEQLGRKTPREYLKAKSVEERYHYGLQVLRDIGVLK